MNKYNFDSNDPIPDFSTTLLEIAERTIPQSSISSKPRKPWFDDECKLAIKERKKSKKHLGGHLAIPNYPRLDFIELRLEELLNGRKEHIGNNLFLPLITGPQ